MPRISVVIPSYNHESFVGAAVASALAQSIDALEVIAVDDASTDGSIGVLDAVRDPRFRYVVHPENRGASATLNTGIRLARGEYVAILDSDDVFLPGKLARQVEVLDANPAIGAVFALAEVIDESGSAEPDKEMAGIARRLNQRNRSRHEWLALMFDHGNCFCHSTSVMRSSLFGELGLYDERLAQLQDYDMWLRLLRRHEVFIVQDKLVGYRWMRSGTNLSSIRRPGRASRLWWEWSRVLRHYLGLSVADVEAIFGVDVVARYRELDMSPELMVIDIATQRPTIVFQAFAVNALFDLLPAYGQTSRWHLHLMALAEGLDPMGSQSILRLQEQLAERTKPAPVVPELTFSYRHRP
jgi:glycosyltransferase involved in cell wall biosynthesis